MIEEFAKLIPSTLGHLSGAVFYSGRNAFQGKKDLYIIGLNPGGSEILQKDQTISWHTKTVLAKENPNWSEYKDEIWRGEPGKYGLQPRILHVLSKLNLSPYDVPASNICFVRSPREKNISNKLHEYVELCWPFHERVIAELEIKVVLCFGIKAGEIVKKKLGANVIIDRFIETNNRRWESQVYKSIKGKIVIVATHPSIADWTNVNTDPSDIVKRNFPKMR
jgi:hypothetical protein